MTPADALLARARQLAGIDVKSLGGVGKGGIGQRVEQALGLHPHFDDIDDPISGVEVKTLPVLVGANGVSVQQGTFVTTASADTLVGESWATSRVKKKLDHVLFVPIVDSGDGSDVRVGTAFLWRPDPATEAQLRADWEDLSDLVARGLGFAVTARRGVFLQLRPKAKNAAQTRQARVVDDDVILRPQGFYLRRVVTQTALEQALNLTGTNPRLSLAGRV